MKKFYTLALTALVGLSAVAGTRQKAVTPPVFTQKTVSEEVTLITPATDINKAPAKAATLKEMEGSYEWSYYGHLNGASGELVGELTLTLTNEATGEVSISGFAQDFVVKGTLDLTAGTLTLPNKQDLGKDKYGDQNYFYIKGLNAAGDDIQPGAMNIAATVGTIAGTTITFPEWELWAIGDFNDEDLGWWTLCSHNALTLLNNNDDPNEGWEDFSTGTFIDGWMIPGYNEDPVNFPWTVNIQKSTADDNLYRLDSPYIADNCPIKANGKKGYIEFDITDPEFVIVFPGVYCGFNNGSNKLNAFNMEGFYVDLGFTKEEITTEITDMKWSTYSDGVVDVQNCRFNMPGALDKAYSWVNEANESLAPLMVSKITFDKKPAGISDVTVNDNNGDVEYFNLQGMRVQNPEGGIFIRRQGKDVQKVIFK